MTGIGSLPGIKRLERGFDTHPYVAPKLKKEQNYTSLPWDFTALSRVKCTFTFTIYQGYKINDKPYNTQFPSIQVCLNPTE
jgi:hypothetical protein